MDNKFKCDICGKLSDLKELRAIMAEYIACKECYLSAGEIPYLEDEQEYWDKWNEKNNKKSIDEKDY
jgi:hypothetical protein